MSEYELYLQAFRAGPGRGLAAEDCACNGCGWLLSQLDTFEQCPDHFEGQAHPECDTEDR